MHRSHVGQRLLDHPVPDVWPVISSALMMSPTPAAISVESVRENRARVTEDDLADLHRDLELDPVPELSALLGAELRIPKIPPAEDGETMYQLPRRKSENLTTQAVRSEVAAELREDVHEDRDEEHEHPDQNEVAKIRPSSDRSSRP